MLRIALAQVEVSDKVQGNLENAAVLSREAATQNANLLVFPEIFMAYVQDPNDNAARSARAEPLDGSFVKAMCALAKEQGLWMVFGMLEAPKDAKDQKVYNTLVVCDDQGQVKAHYRKTHLYDAFGYRESDAYLTGDALFEPLETPWGKMGLMVCYELRFPEIARFAANMGAQFLVMPAAWFKGQDKVTQWEHMIRVRAGENTIFVAGCNQTQKDFTGHSLVAGPLGQAVAKASEQEFLLVADLDFSDLKTARAKVPVLLHRRPKLY